LQNAIDLLTKNLLGKCETDLTNGLILMHLFSNSNLAAAAAAATV